MKFYKAEKEITEIKCNDGTETKITDLFCGKCKNILYGYDEVICPSCGAHNDFVNV